MGKTLEALGVLLCEQRSAQHRIDGHHYHDDKVSIQHGPDGGGQSVDHYAGSLEASKDAEHAQKSVL